MTTFVDGAKSATDKLGAWAQSWAPALWKAWLYIVLSAGVVVLTLFGVLERSKLSEEVWRQLSKTYNWPLWWIVLPVLVTFFSVSAIFIWLLQYWDRRRIDEGERQLTSFANAKMDVEKELRKKTLDLENLEDVFRERERMRMLDHITGIPNFQSWEADLTKWASQDRSVKNFTLILIDLDRLKWLNERSRECADQVLRYFARNTYSSMRRDEQIYKALENPGAPIGSMNSFQTAEMYRHYQGGDEFFFIISGDIFDAIGFVTRLAERAITYQASICETILPRYLNEADQRDFRLSFSAVVMPIPPRWEASTALMNAYSILERAKGEAKSRLLVVVDGVYQEPAEQQAKLERRIEDVRSDLKGLESTDGDPERHAKLARLRLEERELFGRIGILKKAAAIFSQGPAKVQ